MKIGNLDRRVTIQNHTDSRDAFGGITKGWTAVRTESAHYNPGTGSERRIAGQEQSSLAATFTFHSSILTRSISPESHRLSFDGGIWDIISTAALDRNRYIAIDARRRTS